MKDHIDQKPNVVKRYYRLWIVIPVFSLIVLAVSQLVLRTIHCDELQYRSPEQIAEVLLEATPQGTARHTVQQFIDSKGWRRGGLIAGPRHTGGNPADRISVFLGRDRGLFSDDSVFAEWIFDAEDKLVAVRVYKIMWMP